MHITAATIVDIISSSAEERFDRTPAAAGYGSQRSIFSIFPTLARIQYFRKVCRCFPPILTSSPHAVHLAFGHCPYASLTGFLLYHVTAPHPAAQLYPSFV
ncbi:MAG: hypothetical protein ACKPKO_36425, partial [Candidatus Fonsibacter sp.]